MVIEVRPLQANENTLFQQVVELGNKNKKYLGLLPIEALRTYAQTGNLLVAVADGNEVVGYLLYRIVRTRQRASIIHLCVNESVRGQRVTDRLFEHLVQLTRHLQGIVLTCRRDFIHPTRLWPRLGFTPVSERPGRGKERKPLTVWWYSFGTPDLFTPDYDEDLTDVALDANVFFDLCAPDQARSPDVRQLTSDWLRTEIRFVITSETHAEIQRCTDAERRARTLREARAYTVATFDQEERDGILVQLQDIFPVPSGPRAQSDMLQVANAVAANCSYLLTQDGGILGKAGPILAQFNLRVRRPVDFISELDQLANGQKYQPLRRGHHTVHQRAVKGSEVAALATTFTNNQQRERLNDLKHRLRDYVARPAEFTGTVLEENAGNYAYCLLVMTRTADGLDIVLLRESQRRLSLRLLEGQVQEIIHFLARSGGGGLRITDPYLSEALAERLPSYGFWRHDGGWLRYVLGGVHSLEHVKQVVAAWEAVFCPLAPSILGEQVSLTKRGDYAELLHIERQLYPGKIREVQVPCFVVPVQPRWARYLFDERQGQEELFGFELDLLLSRRNVYYRSAHTSLPAHARILWYVSADKSATISALRAASYVDVVVEGTPKDVFSQYEHLGTLKWEDVRTIGESVQAMVFSDTEILPRQVPFANVQRLFVEAHRKPQQFQGPVRISPELFLALYEAAF